VNFALKHQKVNGFDKARVNKAIKSLGDRQTYLKKQETLTSV